MTARGHTWFWIAIAGAALLASLASASPWQARLGGVSPVIFPAQEIPLRFSHVQHLEAEGINCEFCHEDAADSTSALDNLIPGEDTCDICHPIDRAQPFKEVPGEPPARCDACHPGWTPESPEVARVRIPRPNLKFNHKAHRDQGIPCRTCHGDMVTDRVDLATRDQLPTMSLCLTCHDGKQQSNECTLCHLAEQGGYVQTVYPEGTLEPSGVLRGDAHDLTFITDHAQVAANDPDYCESCHRRPFCVECHEGSVKPMQFHLGDYLAMHSIEARRNQPDCSGCHRQQTFCVGCHTRSGVTAGGRGSEFDSTEPDRNYHPPGWASLTDIGPQHHSLQAQRNIEQCASCHREQFCVQCHTAEVGNPVRANPHPPGWEVSRRCRALLARNPRMCLRCHTDGTLPTCGG